MTGEVIGLIPARGGSKGIPGKNLVALAGKPLLSYTSEAALSARLLNRVIVSTDDTTIAAAARELGLDVPFLRPAELSGDGTPMLPVIQHALAWCEGAGIVVSMIVLLQPTSPLRRAQHIDAAIELAAATQAQTVISVVKVPHNFAPDSVMTIDDGRLMPYADGPMILRRQEKPEYLARNGPAVLAIRASTIRQGTLYGEPTVAYEMDAESSIDIDDPEDLWLAEQYIRRRDNVLGR
jgi:CMP-N-acetylneuraminic acid synthetase